MALIVTATNNNIDLAAKLIKSGKLIAFPTETVYGLGANACNSTAVESIFSLKNRPSFNPLILHFNSVAMVTEYFNLNNTELKLAQTFWPGSLTLVLNNFTSKAKNISALCKGNVNSLAVRIPNNSIALQLIAAAGVPLAAPSANISNHLSPTAAQHVAQSFKTKKLLVLDGGKSILGIESTVIEIIKENTVNILRAGAITKEDFINLGLSLANKPKEKLKSPGLLEKHYSPNTPLRINATETYNGEALLAFGNLTLNQKSCFKNARKILNLSADGNIKEAAANLFSMLWELDLGNYSGIAVMPIPNLGIGVAINERLIKAAAKNI